MLVLFETPAGFAIFKLLDEEKLKQSDDLYKDFASGDSAKKMVKMKYFEKFEDTTEALASATSLVEGKMSKGLKKMLKKVFAKDAHERLAVADAKLGVSIQSKLEIKCVADSSISELMRCIRSQLSNLMPGVEDKDMKAMSLGLAHSLSRYKLKFSPDKIDTMIVQVRRFFFTNLFFEVFFFT
jgi:nucleolar protein 58